MWKMDTLSHFVTGSHVAQASLQLVVVGNDPELLIFLSLPLKTGIPGIGSHSDSTRPLPPHTRKFLFLALEITSQGLTW